ncbi:GNAT family N-acetyltransferase [Streptomyces sp. NRRL S-813]|uniref:GNAT family N-acetyltransferase n=1 Tax=Streptomyces sp. NRRL S-813 TaxID=1463919 RepID=UPI0004C2244F|nr:GNAT family N-acetyltransferase [Streptomyces sp. NRRL S-813]
MSHIRGADQQDDKALSAIDSATWSPHVTPAAAREPGSPFFNDRMQPGDVLVAEKEGLVVGYAMLRQSIPMPSHRHVLEVAGLAVDPTQWGQGIGRRLMEEAKREAHQRGARKLSLRVLAPNVTARLLYESCGFTVEGILKAEFLLQGQLVDDVLMACHIA